MDNKRKHEDRHHRYFDEDEFRKRFEKEFRFHRDRHDRDRDRKQKHVHIMKRPHRPFGKTITKLLTSREELVQYVNELGEKGHHIDVYKIETDLYKVVVKMRDFDPIDIDEDVEIEIEEEIEE
ncbi:hypothetical protein [Candidatus Xianfuyuplasma coldseepsis]|uniref:Uncharacterized protein n=1 Tax=Candidatus Xianfuyuplasma coldseepsis TaxID=2782163 RepID=A0A7L7KNC8_9MOLU|nr:hypothetical protein [Xianfuyuplasma coldseepsis]QMS84210.1 hypothetical protein G4Z02_00120 [Xianfuyuplasma coldseepsis]